jgi:hypothetical protein
MRFFKGAPPSIGNTRIIDQNDGGKVIRRAAAAKFRVSLPMHFSRNGVTDETSVGKA